MEMRGLRIVKKIHIYFLLASIPLAFTGCPGLDTQSISISGVGWYIENIDESFWTTPPGAHAFFGFGIAYTGSAISASDLSSIEVAAPDATVWTLGPADCTVDTQNKLIQLPALYKNSTIDVLPIGTFTFRVTLKNGVTSTMNLLVPAPNNTTTGGFTSVHTEDVAGPAASTSLVERATQGTHSLGAGTLSINFSVNDAKVYNGFIWFYDSTGSYVAVTTTRFRDASTGNVLPMVNVGAGVLHTDGTSNAITVTDGDITYQTGRSFSDIQRFIIVLTDGAQYAAQGLYSACDCRSFAAKTAF